MGEESPVAMKVFGEPVTQSQVDAMKAAMAGRFLLADVMKAAHQSGLRYRVYYRAIDRLLQKERKAGRIKYIGSGAWSEIVLPLDAPNG